MAEGFYSFVGTDSDGRTTGGVAVLRAGLIVGAAATGVSFRGTYEVIGDKLLIRATTGLANFEGEIPMSMIGKQEFATFRTSLGPANVSCKKICDLSGG